MAAGSERQEIILCVLPPAGSPIAGRIFSELNGSKLGYWNSITMDNIEFTVKNGYDDGSGIGNAQL